MKEQDKGMIKFDSRQEGLKILREMGYKIEDRFPKYSEQNIAPDFSREPIRPANSLENYPHRFNDKGGELVPLAFLAQDGTLWPNTIDTKPKGSKRNSREAKGIIEEHNRILSEQYMELERRYKSIQNQ